MSQLVFHTARTAPPFAVRFGLAYLLGASIPLFTTYAAGGAVWLWLYLHSPVRFAAIWLQHGGYLSISSWLRFASLHSSVGLVAAVPAAGIGFLFPGCHARTLIAYVAGVYFGACALGATLSISDGPYFWSMAVIACGPAIATTWCCARLRRRLTPSATNDRAPLVLDDIGYAAYGKQCVGFVLRLGLCFVLNWVAVTVPQVNVQMAVASSVAFVLGRMGLQAEVTFHGGYPAIATGSGLGGVIEPGCTYLGVIAGLAPLVWSSQASPFWNGMRMAALLVVGLAANIVRLSVALMLDHVYYPYTITEGMLNVVVGQLAIVVLILMRLPGGAKGASVSENRRHSISYDFDAATTTSTR